MNSNSSTHWKSLETKTLFTCKPWVTLVQETIELPSGRQIQDFFKVLLPSFAVVVAMDEDGKFVLVRGYKHALGTDTLSPPAGLIDEGEDPLTGAKRELLEETGYQSEDWSFLGKYIVDGNRQCGTMYTYLARKAQQVRTPHEDDAEILTVELWNRTDVWKALRSGEFATLPGASAIALALAFDQEGG